MAPKIEITGENTVKITTPMGQVFEIVCKNMTDYITVFSSTNFGSSLLVRPMASNSIIIKETRD